MTCNDTLQSAWAGGEGALSDEALRAFDTAFSGRMEELRAQMQQAKNVNRNAEEQARPV
jgi:hypothetical protein